MFAINSFKNKVRVNDEYTSSLEETLWSKDKMLVGRPDLFAIQNNKALLKELKSSSIYNQNHEIKLEYIEQMLFYAIIIFDNYDIEEVSSHLESLNGDSFKHKILKSESNSMLIKVIRTFDFANKQIESTDDIYYLSNPSLSACRSCQKKIICKKFIENQTSFGSKENIYVLSGKILSATPIFESNLEEIQIQNFVNSTIDLVKVPSEISKNMIIGNYYLLSNLAFEKSFFIWSDKSRIFSNE